MIHAIGECPRCNHCFDGSEEVCPHDGAELVFGSAVELVIAGRYRIESVLGRGGMGSVYEVFDARLGRRAAMKVLTELGDPEALRRLEREARICVRLHHVNIVSVYDFGRTAAGGAFLVMERLEGISMHQAIRRSAPRPATLAGWFDQVLEGLKAAHRERVVHRDLKPSNVFLEKSAGGEERVKILDFGLAKIRDEAFVGLERITLPGALMGTLNYMSPEQLSGAEVDERADLFAVGVMAVEALTGERPFQGDSSTLLGLAILQQEYHLPASVPEWSHLDTVLQKCLAKSPRQRFPSAAALQRELIPALRSCPAPRSRKAAQESQVIE